MYNCQQNPQELYAILVKKKKKTQSFSFYSKIEVEYSNIGSIRYVGFNAFMHGFQYGHEGLNIHVGFNTLRVAMVI